MTSETTRQFRELFAKMPKEVQQQARVAYKLFQADPQHPSLHFKKVHSTEPIWSARINIDYRAVGYLSGDTMLWFWIGSHADYDKLLRQLR